MQEGPLSTGSQSLLLCRFQRISPLKLRNKLHSRLGSGDESARLARSRNARIPLGLSGLSPNSRFGSRDKGSDARRQEASIAVWLKCHSRSAATEPPKQMGP
ncbi:MAG: hypothetical protein EA369_05445 [Bradymonadales bacterium]|nr:MAG: hypothetical protein EA369_05445 [Bradymonadales bacterium]